jgi:hypothetical protein
MAKAWFVTVPVCAWASGLKAKKKAAEATLRSILIFMLDRIS